MAKILQTPNKIDVVKPQVLPLCQNCRWYIKREKPDGIGDCRRYPPTPEGRFALTRADGWCGEFATK